MLAKMCFGRSDSVLLMNHSMTQNPTKIDSLIATYWQNDRSYKQWTNPFSDHILKISSLRWDDSKPNYVWGLVDTLAGTSEFVRMWNCDHLLKSRADVTRRWTVNGNSARIMQPEYLFWVCGVTQITHLPPKSSILTNKNKHRLSHAVLKRSSHS